MPRAIDLLGNTRQHTDMYNSFFKRVIDILLSFAGLFVLFVPLLVVVLLIKLDDPGPAVFKQKRLGRHKKPFELYKFRSMKVSSPKDTPAHLLENPNRYVTRVGAFIRRTSIDELPQLINILRGDMSLIGPRPALWNQDDLVAERDKYGANDVVPGLTGWAQINGRDRLNICEKARLDGEYVRHMGFLFDARCFLGTIKYLITQEEICAAQSNTETQGGSK